MKQYYVYILTNKTKSTLYVGVTNDLIKRVYQHKHKLIKGFSEKYNVNRLVYYEIFSDSYNAIKREKTLKNWKRKWKDELIDDFNSSWEDLYFQLLG